MTSRENRHIAPRTSRTTPIQQIIGADSNPLTCIIYKEERVQKSRKYTVLIINDLQNHLTWTYYAFFV